MYTDENVVANVYLNFQNEALFLEEKKAYNDRVS